MIRRSAKLICILAAAYCLLALMDRWRWTDPVWAKIWPQTVLPRRPSPAEARAAELESRLEVVRQQINATRSSLAEICSRRRELQGQLRDQLMLVDAIGPPPHLEAEYPVVFALVRSIDAEDSKERAANERIALLEGGAARLQAQQIAAESGIPFVNPSELAGPSDQLRALAAEGDTDSRYQRIIQEAQSSEQDEERN